MAQSLHPMLNIAIKAARAAGAIINRGSLDLDLLKVSQKGPNDFVSEVDQAAEAAIIDILLGAYPGHGILAEESGRERGSKDSEFTWIIDPLDGTTNFLHGLPVYAVSIALAHRGVVQQAVVYDPTRNDLFFASRGRGAFLNDHRLRVSRRIRLADALIGTGFPFRRGDSFTHYVAMFQTVMQACAGVRRPGAAALDLCYVAAGWYDGFFETGLSPWDMAAGSLIITEAGGLVGNFTGDADFLYQRELVAGSPKIYGQLVTLLASHSRVAKAHDLAHDPMRDQARNPPQDPAGNASPTQAAGATAPAGGASDAIAAAWALAPRAAARGTAAVPTAPAARERKPVRIRKVGPDPSAEAVSAPAPDDAPRSPARSAGRGARRPLPRPGQRAGERAGDRAGDRAGQRSRGPAKPGSRGPFKPRP